MRVIEVAGCIACPLRALARCQVIEGLDIADWFSGERYPSECPLVAGPVVVRLRGWRVACDCPYDNGRGVGNWHADGCGDRCPHGNRIGECAACDAAGDLAYDAAREDGRR